MTTPQPQPQPQHSPTSASASENRSLAKLREDLGADAELLKYLPYHRTTWAPQNEIKGAGPFRLLYGDMMEEKDQLWIYFTLKGGGHNYNKNSGGTRMIMFYTLKGAQEGTGPYHPHLVKTGALASQPFKLARGQWEIMAIAKYFFIKRGVDKDLTSPISVNQFKPDLLRACQDYKAVYENMEAAKRAANGQPTSKVFAPPSGPRRDEFRTKPLAPPSPQQSSQDASTPAESRRPSPFLDAPNMLKRSHSPSPPTHTITNPARKVSQIPSSYSTSPTPTRATMQPRPRYTTIEREAMVDEYIVLQAREEDLDRKIEEAETERSDAAAQMVGLQVKLDDASNKKWTLMEDKDQVKAEKRRLQRSLEREDSVEFGFEAGRKMESKRLRRE
jgi:hypothetical protein